MNLFGASVEQPASFWTGAAGGGGGGRLGGEWAEPQPPADAELSIRAGRAEAPSQSRTLGAANCFFLCENSSARMPERNVKMEF